MMLLIGLSSLGSHNIKYDLIRQGAGKTSQRAGNEWVNACGFDHVHFSLYRASSDKNPD